MYVSGWPGASWRLQVLGEQTIELVYGILAGCLETLSHFEFCTAGEGRQARKQKDKGHWKPRELGSGTLLFPLLLSASPLLCKTSVVLIWREINRSIGSREIIFFLLNVSYRIFHLCTHRTSD